MSSTFTLSDGAAAADLATLLGRAQRVDDGSVRLIAGGGVLAVYVAVFFPLGLLDESPTILGLRTFRVAETDELDVTVPIASLIARLESARDDARGAGGAVGGASGAGGGAGGAGGGAGGAGGGADGAGG
ncbi:hypothetical protein QT381_15190, partial [Galbitalea sp. SE-J8]|nr:hypothetical protein [Galbitalea sp. SE-J8]